MPPSLDGVEFFIVCDPGRACGPSSVVLPFTRNGDAPVPVPRARCTAHAGGTIEAVGTAAAASVYTDRKEQR